MFVTKDIELYKDVASQEQKLSLPLELFSGTNQPLDVMSTVCKQNPALLILDDDFITPRSAHLLESIRKVKESLNIIFLTSTDSIELGKEITSRVVQYYAIKPITGEELVESINSILKHKSLTSL